MFLLSRWKRAIEIASSVDLLHYRCSENKHSAKYVYMTNIIGFVLMGWYANWTVFGMMVLM